MNIINNIVLTCLNNIVLTNIDMLLCLFCGNQEVVCSEVLAVATRSAMAQLPFPFRRPHGRLWCKLQEAFHHFLCSWTLGHIGAFGWTQLWRRGTILRTHQLCHVCLHFNA